MAAGAIVGALALPVIATTLKPTVAAAALPVPLAAFPQALHGWTGQDLPLSSATQKYLRTNFADDFLCRRYVNEAARQWADLYVLYCSSRPTGIVGQDPTICFPAHGWIRDQTAPSQITTQSGRPIECVVHRFHRSSTREQMVTLCFYLVNGRIGGSEQVFASLAAQPLNPAGNPARYVAQVQISSVLEHSARSAASALADTILDSLPDPNGARPNPPGFGTRPVNYLGPANDEQRIIGTGFLRPEL